MYDGVEKITIAGCEGYMDFTEEEDGQAHFGRAVFITEYAVYDIHIQTTEDILGMNGMKEVIKPLTANG